MKVFFVSGVDTDVGKTFVTRKIVQFLQKRSFKAIAIKPIETGVEEISQSDSFAHLCDAQNLFPYFKIMDINFYAFSSSCAPYVADAQGVISLEQIYTKIEDFQSKVDILLIEGAGGLFVPIKKDFFMLSFAQELQKRFDAKNLIVCDDRLGMINRFLSAKFVLDSLKLRSLFFINLRDKKRFSQINLPFMRHYDFETQIEKLVEKNLSKGKKWI